MKKQETRVSVAVSEDVKPFEGPFYTFDDHIYSVVPGLNDTRKAGDTWTVGEVVLMRDRYCEFLWARILLASCTEQLAFLCAVFSPWDPKNDPTLVEALRAGIRAGLFPVLAKFASHGEDYRFAKATAKALHIGYQHGKTTA